MRELSVARHTWERLKPLETNSDATSMERHLQTQFQLTAPRAETGMAFHPGYSGVLEGRHRSFDAEPSSGPSVRPIYPLSTERSRSISQTLLSPTTPISRGIMEITGTDMSLSEGFSSSEGMGYIDTPATTEPLEKTSSGVGDVSVASPSESIPTQMNQSRRQSTAPDAPLASPPEFSPIQMTQSRLQSPTTVSFKSEPSLKSPSVQMSTQSEKRTSRWKSKLTSSKKDSSKTSGDSSSLSSATLEAQKLEEVSLKSLISSSKFSMRGKNSKAINVSLSGNSAYALFWTQSCINVWDVGMSPPILGRSISTESSCVLAAVTKMHLAYIIGTRDQKLTVRSSCILKHDSD